MKEVMIRLQEIDDVRDFVATTSQFTTDIDLVDGRYIIDAKSILGIFSLDLAKPVKLVIEDDDEAPEVIEALDRFVVSA